MIGGVGNTLINGVSYLVGEHTHEGGGGVQIATGTHKTNTYNETVLTLEFEPKLLFLSCEQDNSSGNKVRFWVWFGSLSFVFTSDIDEGTTTASVYNVTVSGTEIHIPKINGMTWDYLAIG